MTAIDCSEPPIGVSARRNNEDAVPLSYHSPVLRSHGSLRDVTAQSSAQRSDVNLKENVLGVVWS